MLHSQQWQWPYMFLYLVSYFSLSMFHLLRLCQQSIALYNQEMTSVMKESNNYHDAGLLATLSSPPTKEGHSFWCQEGVMIRIYWPQDVFTQNKKEIKSLSPIPDYILSHELGIKILKLNLWRTKHLSWWLVSEKSTLDEARINHKTRNWMFFIVHIAGEHCQDS